MPTENAVISFRVPVGEYEAIQRAAEAAGEAMSTYVRKALAMRMTGGAVGTSYISTGTPYFQQVESERPGSAAMAWTTAPRPTVPEPRIRTPRKG